MILLEYRWEIIVLLLLVLLSGLWLLMRRFQKELRHEFNILSVTNLPRDGLPQHMEAAWEDIGDRGRFLTDLGGMSIGMREQMYEEFLKALNKPISGIPAAGSMNDILSDLDARLTELKEIESDSESTD